NVDVRSHGAHGGITCVVVIGNDHIVAVISTKQEHADQGLVVCRRLRRCRAYTPLAKASSQTGRGQPSAMPDELPTRVDHVNAELGTDEIGPRHGEIRRVEVEYGGCRVRALAQTGDAIS